MTMKIKYFQERERAGGNIYVVNPPKYVKTATGAEYKQFSDKSEAVAYALRVADQFQSFKRGEQGKVHVDDTVVEGLINHYRTTDEYLELKPNSKTHYGLMFKTTLNTRIGTANQMFGQVAVKSVNTAMVDAFYKQIKADISHHRANSCVKVLKRVYNIGLRHGKVNSNPWQMLSMKATADRKVRWERGEVTSAIAACDRMGLHDLGTMIVMCYHLCQRPGDIRQMKWSNFDGEAFLFTQEKTSFELEVVASPLILERLARKANGHRDDFILYNDENGLPHDRFSYAKQLRRVRIEAGIRTELQMSDLRRTGATEMGESNCTEDELAAVTGHQSRAILKTYVRPTRKMAQNAISKRFG
jgi:hypothetical protein